jgi:hypothetical protein
MGQVESRFSQFGESVSVGARLVHGLCRTYHRIKNHFGRTRWNCQMTCVMWNLILVYFEIVLVSVQDRCTVHAKHTIGSKIVLDAPDRTPRRHGSSGILVRSVWRGC